jgi:hypothetical protein
VAETFPNKRGNLRFSTKPWKRCSQISRPHCFVYLSGNTGLSPKRCIPSKWHAGQPPKRTLPCASDQKAGRFAW